MWFNAFKLSPFPLFDFELNYNNSSTKKGFVIPSQCLSKVFLFFFISFEIVSSMTRNMYTYRSHNKKYDIEGQENKTLCTE